MSDAKDTPPDKPEREPAPDPEPASSTDEPRRDRTTWRRYHPLETLAYGLTVLLALGGIGLSVWQGYENRRFYQLSVLPHLEAMEATMASESPIRNEYFLLPAETDSVYAIGYSVENSGLGPAVLENLLVYHGDSLVFDAAQSGRKHVPWRVKDDLDRLPFPSFQLNYGYSAGQMLETDEIHHLITVAVPFSLVDEDSLDRAVAAVVIDVLEQYSYVFCYCSVYGTHCDMAYLGGEPPATDVCEF